MTPDDRRTVLIEWESPSTEPTLRPPHHPGWERFLPGSIRKERRRKRTAAAFEEWRDRVKAWEAAGQPPDIHRMYAPAADVKATPLPNGDTKVTVNLMPDLPKLSAFYYGESDDL